MNNQFKKIFLLAGDLVVLYLSLYLMLLIRYQQLPASNIWESHFWPFSITFIAWIIVFYISDLYNLHLAVNDLKFFKLTIRSVIIASAISAIFFYATPSIQIAPKTNLVIYLFVFAILFFLWRRFYNLFLFSYLPKDNVIIIGRNEQADELIKYLQNKPHLGYKIAHVIENNNLEKIKNLKKIIIDEKVNTVIFVSDPHQLNELRSSLFSCLPLKVNIFSLPNFYEKITGKIPIEAISQMWFLENLNEGGKKWFNFSKRIIDTISAFLILILTALFWPIIAVIIKLESRGPVFFRQARVGKNNKIFPIVKFRTMKIENNDHAPTKSNDLRVTKFGNFLRKTRIDEIPQIINVIAGDMSFIGPRPERPELIKELEQKIPFYQERTLVKPGLTGWDQISGEYHSASYEDTLKKLQYDLFYIKNRSLYLDLSIFLKTIATVLSRKGV